MLATDLLDTKPIQVGEWQTIDVSKSDVHKTHELEDVTLAWDQLPSSPVDTFPAIDTAWAWEHFGERVSGIPYNPAPSHERWPYAVRGNADHIDGDTRFDHTYPERFWPQHAGHDHKFVDQDGVTHHVTDPKDLDVLCDGQPGIRFQYGDLNDLVNLFIRSPMTRQAYLPVWFPEDTGAVDGQRVPCTLGYHFMQRRGFLSCRYYIRSCDFYRHLSNDVFFAAALMNWICQQLAERTKDREMKLRFRPGSLVMHISSLHAFVGDDKKIKDRINQVSMEAPEEMWGTPV
jgi:hypothetical protein